MPTWTSMALYLSPIAAGDSRITLCHSTMVTVTTPSDRPVPGKAVHAVVGPSTTNVTIRAPLANNPNEWDRGTTTSHATAVGDRPHPHILQEIAVTPHYTVTCKLYNNKPAGATTNPRPPHRVHNEPNYRPSGKPADRFVTLMWVPPPNIGLGGAATV